MIGVKRLAEQEPLTVPPGFPRSSMVYLAAYLGLRWSEVGGLRVKRIDLLRRTVTVAETAAQVGGFADVKSKSGRGPSPCPPFLADMLAAHLALRGLTAKYPEALLFVAPRGGRLHVANWHKREWKKAVERSGLELKFHGLRHTSVGLMVAAGTHPKVIQQRLGHSSWTTTMDIYATSSSPSTTASRRSCRRSSTPPRRGTGKARPARRAGDDRAATSGDGRASAPLTTTWRS